MTKPPYVGGIGPIESKLMVIGEAPGAKETEQGVPFVGPSGSLLNDCLSKAGISRSEVYITNVVKHQPPANDFKRLNEIGVDLGQSIRELWDNEIHQFRPNCILAIGNEALKAVTSRDSIMHQRGSILLSNDGVIKVVPTIHPAALFPHGESAGLAWIYLKLIEADIERAVEESRNAEYNIPNRLIRIARNSLDVYRFVQENKNRTRAASDIESINCIPVSISFAFDAYESLTIPLLSRVGLYPLTDMGYSELAECWKLIQELLHEKDIVGQNFKYDQFKLGLCGFRVRRVCSDTLLKTHTIIPELPSKSLAMQTSLWTREPYYKDDGKEPKVGKKFDIERFFIYNGRDSCVTFEIDEAEESELDTIGRAYSVPLKDFYYNYVMRKHNAYLRLESRGLTVDNKAKQRLKEEYETSWDSAHQKLVSLIGQEINTKSNPQMYDLLYKALKFPTRKHAPCSEDSIIALLGNHCKGKDAKIKREILETILEERRLRDQLSRSINFTPDYDGKCRCSYRIEGTETARSSTGILKKPLRPKTIGLSFHTIPKHGRLSKNIRSMFVPSPGKVFIQGDLSQAEARIVAVLAEDYELLKAFDEIDIHRRTAGLFFNLSTSLILSSGFLKGVDDLSKDGPERFVGKMFRHAGNYDMGKARAMNEFNVNAQKYEIPMSISEWKAGEFLRLFHSASPRIRDVFHFGIKNALDSSRVLINPYGRPRTFFGKYEDDLYKEGYAYIPQSTVADTTQSALLEIDDEWKGEDVAYIVSENHDALVAEVPEKKYEKYADFLKAKLTRTIDFGTYCTLRRNFKLTIPVDIEVSDTHYANFQKLNKFRPKSDVELAVTDIGYFPALIDGWLNAAKQLDR